MRKPLAYRPLKNRAGLTPVGLDAIVLRSLSLFCILKHSFDCFNKFIFGADRFWCFRRWIRLMSNLFFPICLLCCFTVMIQGMAEGTEQEKRKIILEFSSSSIDGIDGVLSYSVFFVKREISSGIWINTFKFFNDKTSKFFGSLKIFSACNADKGNYETYQYNNDPNGSIWKRRTISIDKFLHMLFWACVIGLVIGMLSPLR
jgi:hypothetical protein